MASGLGMRGGVGRCFMFFSDFRDCFNDLKKPKSATEMKALKEEAEVRDKQISQLSKQMNERFEASPTLKARFKEIQDSVHSDPKVSKMASKIEKSVEEGRQEIARQSINKFMELVDAKPEWQEALEAVPELKTLQELERERLSKPHPAQVCIDIRDDYFECLHSYKYKDRMNEIHRVQQLKEKGLWNPESSH